MHNTEAIMHKTLTFTLVIGATLGVAALAPPALAADVGVSVTVGEPGFYGRIDIGDVPRPRLIYTEPVIIEQVSVVRAPVYMRVPPGHAKDWSKHCRKYGACGQRVYFVEDGWYDTVYVPHHREKHGRGHHAKGKNGKGQKNDKGKGKKGD